MRIARWTGLLALLALPTGAQAQPAPASREAPEGSPVAVGGQAGSFGGLSVRLPARTPQSFVLTLVMGDETVLGSAARSFDMRLPGSPLRLFVAPGLYAGSEGNRASVGALALVGFGFYRHRFDVYLQAVPGVRFTPHARSFVRTAAGLRYAL